VEFWERLTQSFFANLFSKVVFGGGWELEKKVKRVKELIDEASRSPQVKRIAVNLANTFGNTTPDEFVIALGEWVKDNIRYVKEKRGADFFQPADYTLMRGAGDCEDMTILIGGIAKVLGYPVICRVSSPNGTDWKHIYPLVGVPPQKPKRWIVLDATLPAPIGTEEKVYPYKKDF